MKENLIKCWYKNASKCHNSKSKTCGCSCKGNNHGIEVKGCSYCGRRDGQLQRVKGQGRFLCSKHYRQIRIRGEFYKNRREPNELVKKGKYTEIIIYDRNDKEKTRALIDTKDVEKIKNYKWCSNSKNGYVSAISVGGEHRAISLHRIILGEKRLKSLTVDHINHNPLDNRRSNLRIVTTQQNMMNVSVRKGRKYKGASYDKSRANEKNKWISTLTFNKKVVLRKRFPTEIEAAIAYNEAAKKYHGKYAHLNKI